MDEERIIAQAKRGDQEAFGELFDRYQPFVWNMALRMTGDCDEAEDVAQEVFVTVWKKLPQFQGLSTFSTWLYRISVNRTLSFIKRRTAQKLGRSQIKVDLDDNAHTNNPSASIEKKEAEKVLGTLLARLDPERRMALILRDIEGLSYTEIAAATGVPVGTVRSRIARGRKELESQAGAMRELT